MWYLVHHGVLVLVLIFMYNFYLILLKSLFKVENATLVALA